MAAELTDLQIAMCRADIGDTQDPLEVSSDMLQALFDDVTLANGNLNLLRVYALRQRRGLAVNQVDDSGNIAGINSRSNQKLTNIERLLAWWEALNGMSMGQTTSSTHAALQRSDQQTLNVVFAWQADAFANRLLTNDPNAIQQIENVDD